MNVNANFLGTLINIDIPENVNHFWITIDENGEINSHFDSPRYDNVAEGWRSTSRSRINHIGHTVSSDQAKDICSFYTIKWEAERLCDYSNVYINDAVKFMASIKPENLAEGLIKMVATSINNAEECTTFRDGFLHCYDVKNRFIRILVSKKGVYVQHDNLAFFMQVIEEGIIKGCGWDYDAVNTSPETMLNEAILNYHEPVEDTNLVIFTQMAMSAWKKAEKVDTNAL